MNPETLVHEGKVLSLFYVGPEDAKARLDQIVAEFEARHPSVEHAIERTWEDVKELLAQVPANSLPNFKEDVLYGPRRSVPFVVYVNGAPKAEGEPLGEAEQRMTMAEALDATEALLRRLSAENPGATICWRAPPTASVRQYLPDMEPCNRVRPRLYMRPTNATRSP